MDRRTGGMERQAVCEQIANVRKPTKNHEGFSFLICHQDIPRPDYHGPLWRVYPRVYCCRGSAVFGPRGRGLGLNLSTSHLGTAVVACEPKVSIFCCSATQERIAHQRLDETPTLDKNPAVLLGLKPNVFTPASENTSVTSTHLIWLATGRR